MRKSLFIKYFSICAAVIIISLTLLGAIMMLMAAQYFKTDKYELLKSNVTGAVEFTVENCDYDEEKNSVLIGAPVRNTYGLLANAINAQLLLIQTDGQANFTVGAPDPSLPDKEAYLEPIVGPNVSGKILETLKKTGEYFEIGTLGGIYESQHYTYGLPILLDDKTLIGYLFASVPAIEMLDFIVQMLQMFCMSSVFVILLSFIGFYFVTLQMVKPLRRMAFAAKKFGSGDFSERLKVTSEDEIADLAVALNNMAQSLSITESSRRNFVANVSHELRTPMTTISGFVDGILDGTIPKEQEREYLTIVSDETKRLSRLVRAMLNMSRIESGEIQINKTNFDLLDVILQTLFSFEHDLEEKRVDVQGLDHDKVIIEADKDLIHQVVYNLVENAVKFVDNGGVLSFHFLTEGGRTYVRIRNTGAGLSNEEIQRVFERFYKSDKSRSRDKSGVGLGLNIVRSIINMHGGEITVRSVEGEYCEFEFWVASGKMSKALKKPGKNEER